jgi:hypothetical protein
MEMQPTFESAAGISFASGADALCEQLISIYKDKKDRGTERVISVGF